jgi:hypothetical protein
MIKLIERQQCPNWVKYPYLYVKLINENKDEFLPWYLMEAAHVLSRLDGVRERYPRQDLFPFARRDDNDDIACWEKDMSEKVVIVHDFASSGWERRQIFDTFEDWYTFALSEQGDEEHTCVLAIR